MRDAWGHYSDCGAGPAWWVAGRWAGLRPGLACAGRDRVRIGRQQRREVQTPELVEHVGEVGVLARAGLALPSLGMYALALG